MKLNIHLKILSLHPHHVTKHELSSIHTTFSPHFRDGLPVDESVISLIPHVGLEGFKKNVTDYPDAILGVGSNLTYADADRLSNALANFLERGVGLDLPTKGALYQKVVAVDMRRSPEMIITILALWKAGAIPYAVSSRYHPKFATKMLRQTHLSAIIASSKSSAGVQAYRQIKSETAPSSEGIPPLIVSIKKGQVFVNGRVLSEETDTKPRPFSKEDVAFICGTSGSTGLPKMAQTLHKGMCLNQAVKARCYGLEQRPQIVAQTSSTEWNVMYEQMFSTTCFHSPKHPPSQLSFISEASILDFEETVKELAACKATVLQVTPSHLNELLPYLKSCMEAGVEFAIERLFVTGEATKKEILDNWFSLFPHALVINGAGATEASGDSFIGLANKATYQRLYDQCGTLPVGQPYPQTSISIYKADEDGVLIKDEKGHFMPVPEGESGGVVVGGLGVGPGYLHNPEQTKASFFVDPVTHEPCYFTGDKGRRVIVDGNPWYVLEGRLSQQTKQTVGTHKVEPKDIAKAVAEGLNINESRVIVKAVPIKHNNQFVVYIKRSADAFNFNRLFIGQSLDALRVRPMAYVLCDSFPLAKSSGKLDIKALPHPEHLTPGYHLLKPGSQSSIQQVLKVLQNFLKQQGIPEHSPWNIPLRYLGLHSVTIKALSSTIQRETGILLTVADIFKLETIENLLAFVQNRSQFTTFNELFKAQPFRMFNSEASANHAEKQGIPVCKMTLGINQSLPEPVIAAMKKAMDTPSMRNHIVPQGLPELRQAIVDSFSARYNTQAFQSIDQCFIAPCGMSSYLPFVFAAILRDQTSDRHPSILLPKPGYTLEQKSAEIGGMASGKDVRVQHYQLQPDGTFDRQAFATLVQEHKPRIVFFNTPGNPLGNILTKDDWVFIVKTLNALVSQGHHMTVVSDETYDRVIFNGHEFFSIAQFLDNPDLPEDSKAIFNVIVTFSASKADSMYGWRISGLLTTDASMIPTLTGYNRHFGLTANVVGQHGFLASLQAPEHASALTKSYEQRANYAWSLFNTKAMREKGISMVMPKGGFYITLNVSVYLARHGFKDAVELSEAISKQTENPKVFLTPGDDFRAPDTLRLSVSPENFNEGISALADYFLTQ